MMVQMGQQQKTEQKLTLTREMRQSLKVLQMALPELREYIQEEALANPLLELEEGSPELPVLDRSEEEAPERSEEPFRTGQALSLEELAQPLPQQDFTQMLREQLVRMPGLTDRTRSICEYLIECLDERGYLLFSLQEIAKEQGFTLFEAEQALYVLQSLQPAGVGARTLEECLVLQLAAGSAFSAQTIKLVTQGLPLLARSDYKAIMELLQCGRRQAEETAEAVRSLNPIPSQGYYTGDPISYRIPEAEIQVENGTLTLTMNDDYLLPKMKISASVTELLRQDQSTENSSYLKTNTAAATQLIRCVSERRSTIHKLLALILKKQQKFFLGGELTPMTMGQLADEAGLNISTVSRALQEKIIRFNGRTVLVRDLFARAASGESVTGEAVRQQLARFIQNEDKQHPLSDESLRAALEAMQMSVSRRTVTKYREELGIPSSSRRKSTI